MCQPASYLTLMPTRHVSPSHELNHTHMAVSDTEWGQRLLSSPLQQRPGLSDQHWPRPESESEDTDHLLNYMQTGSDPICWRKDSENLLKWHHLHFLLSVKSFNMNSQHFTISLFFSSNIKVEFVGSVQGCCHAFVSVFKP